MAFRLFGGNPFEEQVEKATSELLPRGQDEIALYYEISDMIRSKSVTPKEAIRILKKRITHSNPNVQLLALNLTDTCVKNGGGHFLIEIASRDFVDTLASMVRSPNVHNPEVTEKILALIQTWGLAFEKKPELTYVTDTYRLLKQEGYVFPKVDKANAIMVDSAAPPEWSDSDFCMRCRTPFTFTNRKHHCRNCGQTFCGECSSKNVALPHIGINDPVRVCDACFIKKQLKTISSTADPSVTKSFSSSAPSTLYSSFPPLSNGNDNTSNIQETHEENDDELKKAIELSLKEAEYNKNYVQPALQRAAARSSEPLKKLEQEAEEDIAAAIEASLRDMQINSNRYPSSVFNALDSSPYNLTLSSNELSPIEAENIHHFSELLERIQQSGSDLMRDRQIQELHGKIGELKPKLTKSLTETIQKHQDLVDMHEKLTHAAKLYDKLLEERMYNRRTSIASYSIPQRVSSPVVTGIGNMYPSVVPITQSSSVYPYPVASAPAPSPTYYATQTTLPAQYVQPKSIDTTAIGTQQDLQSRQQQSPQQTQSPPNVPYAYASAQVPYASTQITTDAINSTSAPVDYNAIQPQQGYAIPTNGTSAYAPQPTYGADIGYQCQQQAVPSQQPDYYSYAPQSSSSQIIPQTQTPKLEEAPPLIEL
ncbi:11572_t:CDS:10 [Acaulospora morrowiae]|uniref:Vacuolar protein sorting-associated protein 27 n=1 Tax=Acaulospora morrowiae TaxID=94023 RepID=A0A9N9GY67_9GLOM|nr:11572_t:CDS:10 [Acaulospora morrowiae]